MKLLSLLFILIFSGQIYAQTFDVIYEEESIDETHKGLAEQYSNSNQVSRSHLKNRNTKNVDIFSI